MTTTQRRRGTRGGGAGRPLSRLLAFLIAALLSFQTFLFLTHEAAIAVVFGSSSSSSSSSSIVGGPSSASTKKRKGGPTDAPDDGTTATTFTPEEFLAGNREKYVNLPIIDYSPPETRGEDALLLRDDEVRELMDRDVPLPSERLVRMAPIPPGHDAILGLASYPNGFATGWRRLVGSLRRTGYVGHVIMGVHPDIPRSERDYLDRMGVTYYAIEVSNCTPSILDGISDDAGGKNAVRAKCSTGLEDMKLEWGRYEMARRWLRACTSCTGWSMVIDTRDVFFQSDPFASLGDPHNATHDLLFVEEISSHTNTLLPNSTHRATNLGRSVRYLSHVIPCYGANAVDARSLVDRPMLCSGTVMGTRGGMHRFLSVLVDEFRRNNGRGRPECRSPGTTDQWTMNHLYYRGRFGNIRSTRTLPWGTGPVLTVGTPCVDPSMTGKRERTGRRDMMEFDEGTGLILNPHEVDGSACRVAPAVHQYDRCHGWIRRWFEEHGSLFGGVGEGEGEV